MEAAHEVRDDQTLGALLRSVAYTRLPTQFYQMLQLAIPLAFQFWSYGLYRTALWMVVVSLFGIWALCVKRLDGTDPRDRRFAWPRIGRSLALGAGGALAGVLMAEAALRFLAFALRCPRCIG
jgi:hypothetical protein